MKKVLSVLLATVMILSLAACGNKAKKAIDVKVGDTVTDYVISVSDKTPQVTLTGTYTVDEPDSGDDYECLGRFINTDESATITAFGIYTWDKEGTLLEEAQATADEEGSKLTAVESDYWLEEGDYHYAYTSVFDEKYFADYKFLQLYFFEDGDKIIEYAYALSTKTYLAPIGKVQIFLPNYGEDIELTEEDKEDGLVLDHRFDDYEYPNVRYYEWEDDDTIEETAEWFEEKFDCDVLEVSTFENKFGDEVESVYVEYESEGFYWREYCDHIGDYYFATCYYSDIPIDDYDMAGICALSAGVMLQ